LLLLAGSAFAFAPLTQLDGGAFLLLYLALMIVCWLTNSVQRAMQSRSPGNSQKLSAVEAAMLQHGYERSIQTAEVELMQEGVLEVRNGVLSDTGKVSELRTQSLIHEDALHLQRDIARRARVVRAYRTQLEAKKIMLSPKELKPMRLLLALPWLALLIFGALRIALAIGWEKPFVILIMLMIFAAVLMSISIARLSRASGGALAQLTTLKRRADLRQPRLANQYALACAVFGAGALAGTSLDVYAQLRTASSAGCGSSGCGTSGGGGDGGEGGGSGCGGCGGGD
jgi:uncharacterized protein (TIGR04222 family)